MSARHTIHFRLNGESVTARALVLGNGALHLWRNGLSPGSEPRRIELANRGAEVIAWPVWGCNPLLAQARACENHVYLVSSTYMQPRDEWMVSAVFDPAGKPIGHIRLPERCANLCFGGARRNRLFMASSHSLYALYVETRGAV